MRSGPQGARVIINGRQLVNFGANDYLGLAGDPRLADAVKNAAASGGWGSGASPLVSGWSSLHAELERRLATFEGTDSALLFPTGFAANMGTVPALVDRNDVIFSDAKNHASIIDGCRLSRARVEVYPHGDVDALRRGLVATQSFPRRLIVTDALFSMDGDLAPLPELAALADQFGAMLMVDEAHATGVFGQHGRGISESLGVEGGVHIRVGTLSKALGGVGGFVAGSHPLIDWLANRARCYVFSTALPAAAAAAALVALDIVRDEPQRRSTLLARAERLREQLVRCGWSVGRSSSHIIPLVVGDAERTMHLSSTLCERGFFVPGIRPPTVPHGESLLRISVSCLHTEADIARLVEAIERA
jgi:8-amino-7-oxononanoate synthase